jgi:hypothetical protein
VTLEEPGARRSGRLELAMTVLVYVALCLVPAAVFELGAKGLERWTRYSGGRDRPPGAPDERSECDGHARTLRRLATDHERLLAVDVAAKASRLRAVELAYDDTLREACHTLNVDAPAAPFSASDRVQVEADLILRGLTW